MHHLPSSALNNLSQDVVACAPKGAPRYMVLLIELPAPGDAADDGVEQTDSRAAKPPIPLRVSVGSGGETHAVAWNLAAMPPDNSEADAFADEDPVSPVLHAARSAIRSLSAVDSPLPLSQVWAAVLPSCRNAAAHINGGTCPESPCRIVELALGYLEQNFHRPVRMKDVAGLAGVSVQHFCRVFGKQTGQPFVKYLGGIRAAYAARLLSSTAKSISRIASESGFGSIAQFNRIFRRYYNQKPRDYRYAARDGQVSASSYDHG